MAAKGSSEAQRVAAEKKIEELQKHVEDLEIQLRRREREAVPPPQPIAEPRLGFRDIPKATAIFDDKKDDVFVFVERHVKPALALSALNGPLAVAQVRLCFPSQEPPAADVVTADAAIQHYLRTLRKNDHARLQQWNELRRDPSQNVAAFNATFLVMQKALGDLAPTGRALVLHYLKVVNLTIMPGSLGDEPTIETVMQQALTVERWTIPQAAAVATHVLVAQAAAEALEEADMETGALDELALRAREQEFGRRGGGWPRRGRSRSAWSAASGRSGSTRGGSSGGVRGGSTQPAVGRNRTGPNGLPVCNACGQEGHIARGCWNQRQGKGRGAAQH